MTTHSTDRRPVLVGTDPDGPDAAVRWAAAEAVRRHTPLLVLPRRAVVGVDPADAALVVLDAAPGVEDIVTGARCLTVVVPDGTGRDDADGGPVVLAMGPTTGPEAVGFALREAELRGVGLRVVRTWDDPTVDLGRPQPAAIARWDAADGLRRREVARHLAGPLRDHPDVRADVVVVHESCGGLLPAFAAGAALVVTGRPPRHGGAQHPAEPRHGAGRRSTSNRWTARCPRSWATTSRWYWRCSRTASRTSASGSPRCTAG